MDGLHHRIGLSAGRRLLLVLAILALALLSTSIVDMGAALHDAICPLH